METNKKKLARTKKVIGLLKKFTPRKCTMPILSYVHANNRVFEATDLESHCIVYRDQTITTKIIGAGCFRLADAETLWNDGGSIDKGVATLSTGKLIGVDSEEYPNIRMGREDLKRLSSYEPSTCEFWNDLLTVTRSASTDPSRYNLTGVCFSGSRISAVDGHRLALTNTCYNFPGSSLVPATFLQKFSGCDIKTVSFYHTNDAKTEGYCEVTGLIAGYDFRASVRLLDAQYPEIDQVLKGCSANRFCTVASDILLPHLKKCCALITDKTKKITVVLNGDLRITARDPQFGEYAISLPYDSNVREAITVGFNASYLIDTLSDDICDVYGNDANGPWLIKAGNVEHVLMPIRLE